MPYPDAGLANLCKLFVILFLRQLPDEFTDGLLLTIVT